MLVICPIPGSEPSRDPLELYGFYKGAFKDSVTGSSKLSVKGSFKGYTKGSRRVL